VTYGNGHYFLLAITFIVLFELFGQMARTDGVRTSAKPSSPSTILWVHVLLAQTFTLLQLASHSYSFCDCAVL